jgi:hypothetical protein
MARCLMKCFCKAHPDQPLPKRSSSSLATLGQPENDQSRIVGSEAQAVSPCLRAIDEVQTSVKFENSLSRLWAEAG